MIDGDIVDAKDYWRYRAMEIASKYGLEHEVEEWYDKFIIDGDDPEKAASCALMEWDI